MLLEAQGDSKCSWDSQHCGHELESEHPQKDCSPVTQFILGDTRVVGVSFPSGLVPPQELLLEGEPMQCW